MPVIRVDFQSLDNAVKQVDQYVSLIDCNINLCQAEVDNLLSRWNGPDASKFAEQWANSIKENEATVNCLKDCLRSFSKYLSYCRVHYEHEQTEAITRSGWLYVL